jgi:hypothetical protein
MAFSAFFMSRSARNWPFLPRFRIFQAALKSYLPSLTPSTTTPGLGTPPANSRRTKQFLSHPHDLLYHIYIYIKYYILYYIYYIYILELLTTAVAWPRASLWSPEKSYMTSSCTATSIYIAANFGLNLVNIPLMASYLFTVYCAEDQASVKAYHRIIVKITGFYHIHGC